MQTEKIDLTTKLEEKESIDLVKYITQRYEDFESNRSRQLSDIRVVRESIYSTKVPSVKDWNTDIELPDIYELAQTLKAHISENLYSHADGMFDVSGVTPQAQMLANRQKAMLVNTFEQMNIENELEKIIDSVVETGECTLFVGWETKNKNIRRAKTIEEQLTSPDEDSFVVENKIVYDNAKVKYIKAEDFVFDTLNKDNWDSCAKVYRTSSTFDEVQNNSLNNALTPEKLENLKMLITNKKNKDSEKGVDGKKLEILEYWGDIELPNGKLLKNWLIVVAGRKEIIRFEANPFVINPFIHANIIESPNTNRGISPLKVAIVMNNISSNIMNKQLDALALMMNPPYLAPKGCFKGEQEVRPGKIIEYDTSLMPQAPIPLTFDKALNGWDFLNYFKNSTENATGIFKNMAGNIQNQARTATEINYSVTGQSARLNMILDSISRKIIIPMVEKTAEIIANFKVGKEVICLNDSGKYIFLEIDDSIRGAQYIYRYGDRKATAERKLKLKELFEVVKSFAEVPTLAEKIDWIECFKYALEQYGIENSNNFLMDEI